MSRDLRKIRDGLSIVWFWTDNVKEIILAINPSIEGEVTSLYIQKILEESNEVKAIVGNDEHKIFPLLQPDNLNFPFIVHARTGLSVQYTKDIEIGHVGWCNTINYTITCVSNDYIQCIELANAVRHAVETYRWKDNDIVQV